MDLKDATITTFGNKIDASRFEVVKGEFVKNSSGDQLFRLLALANPTAGFRQMMFIRLLDQISKMKEPPKVVLLSPEYEFNPKHYLDKLIAKNTYIRPFDYIDLSEVKEEVVDNSPSKQTKFIKHKSGMSYPKRGRW